MKQRHMLALLQTGFTTIQVSFPPSKYEPRNGTGSAGKTYTYKARGWVEVGDSVVVENGGAFSIAVVKGVDKMPCIDPDADFTYKWIVQKVDRAAYDKVQVEEQVFNDTLAAIEQERLRETVLAQFTNHLVEGSKAWAMFDEAVKGITNMAVTV